jgi:endonuclease/exonuclease/phosphatase (EEP) superfamily protein YafD
VKPARTALKSDTKARVAHQTTTGVPGPAAGQPPARAPRLSRLRQLLRLCSWASLTTILAATVVLWFVSEQTWWGTALTFLPRHAFLAMPAVLLVASLLIYRRMIFVNLAAVLVAAFPLMGARMPLTLPAEDGDGLRVVSCNVQRYEPDFDLVLREITAHQPDVVALQEALWTDERLGRTFPGWHTIQEDEYWIGSRYPLKRIGDCHSKPFDRVSGLSVEIETPHGPIRLHNLHLTTARFGFAELTFRSILDGKGPAFVEKYTNWRRDEALECRAEVDRHGAKLPQLIVGDFNTPTVSEIYDTAWHGFANAFEVAGWGFGYTAPCTTHRHWLNFVPWVRIDHILVDDHWTVGACGIGSGNGSDHRLIWSLVKPR